MTISGDLDNVEIPNCRILSEGHKNYSTEKCLIQAQLTFLILLFKLSETTTSKIPIPDSFESHNSLKLSFTNI